MPRTFQSGVPKHRPAPYHDHRRHGRQVSHGRSFSFLRLPKTSKPHILARVKPGEELDCPMDSNELAICPRKECRPGGWMLHNAKRAQNEKNLKQYKLKYPFQGEDEDADDEAEADMNRLYFRKIGWRYFSFISERQRTWKEEESETESKLKIRLLMDIESEPPMEYPIEIGSDIKTEMKTEIKTEMKTEPKSEMMQGNSADIKKNLTMGDDEPFERKALGEGPHYGLENWTPP